MATPTNLGLRRNAAQLHALAGVEREVRASDPSGRRKYLRDFGNAFRSYESILNADQLTSHIHSADVILIGDYHALPASQHFAATLVEQRAQPGDRPIVLGVETIFSRHQHILEEWWRREIDEGELRQRIRFDLDWNYDWPPFYELLVTAREHADAVYGLDCMPREDLRKIGARDRHAADKIAEIRQRHPKAVILALFGESHLAPQHLPRALNERLTGQRVLTVLQNVDALYWKATGARQERVEAVRVSDEVVCVFNATPLEKYESYRLCLSRWSHEEDEQQADIAPTIYNLIDSLLRFLDVNRYSSHNGTQPKFLVDLLPEVHGGGSDARLRRLLERVTRESERIEGTLQRVEARGLCLSARNQCVLRSRIPDDERSRGSRALLASCVSGIATSPKWTSEWQQVSGPTDSIREPVSMPWLSWARGCCIRRARLLTTRKRASSHALPVSGSCSRRYAAIAQPSIPLRSLLAIPLAVNSTMPTCADVSPGARCGICSSPTLTSLAKPAAHAGKSFGRSVAAARSRAGRSVG